MFTLRRLKVNTLRIKLYRAILYNFNCKIYIRDFAQHLSPPFFSSLRLCSARSILKTD